MTETAKKLLKLALRIAGTTALLIWVFTKIPLSEITANLGSVRWGYCTLVWAITLLLLWLRAVKMKLILEKQCCPLGTGVLFGTSAVTALYNLVLPGVMSSGVKWYLIRKHTGKGENVLSAMFYNQTSDVVTFFCVGLIALMIANPTESPRLPIIYAVIAAAIIIISLLLLSQTLGGKLIKLCQRCLKPFPQVVQRKGGRVFEQIGVFQIVGWQFHLTMLMLNLVRMVFCASLFFFAAKTANVGVGFVVTIWLFVLTFLLGKLPISVGNLGIREVTLVHALAPYGVPPAKALLMSMIIFSTVLLMAAIGAAFLLKGPFKLPKAPSANAA